MGFACGGSDNDAADDAREAEERRQAEIREGTARINSIFDQMFSDRFFADRGEAYRAYHMPQLDQQRGDAEDELTFALSRSGNLESSSRASLGADIAERYKLARQQILDQALAHEGAARGAVEDSRAGLITHLNVTGDASQAASQAIARSEALATPAAFNPLSQMFADITSSLGTQAAQDRAWTLSGGTGFRPATGLFRPNPGAVVNS